MADSRVLATACCIHIQRRVAVLRDSSHFRGFRSAGGGEASRAWHPREFGAVLGGSASLPLHAPPLPSSSRRYAPQCFVAGIPSPRLATCLTAHPANRVGACRSVRHSPPRPLPHLPQGAFFFAPLAAARQMSRAALSPPPDSPTRLPHPTPPPDSPTRLPPRQIRRAALISVQSATDWGSRHLGGVSNCRDFVRTVIAFRRA